MASTSRWKIAFISSVMIAISLVSGIFIYHSPTYEFRRRLEIYLNKHENGFSSSIESGNYVYVCKSIDVENLGILQGDGYALEKLDSKNWIVSHKGKTIYFIYILFFNDLGNNSPTQSVRLILATVKKVE